jgi:hypothetical protein
MGFTDQLRRVTFAVLASCVIAIGGLSASIVSGALSPAAAQIPEDAQIALEQYGGWRPHPRFGEVWVPGAVSPDWRPYQYGHWVYTDEWGWYWVSDDVEADWGWVVYHYGRWAFERGFGWFWVPGDDWAPAWVDWRYGDEYVGWAPMPPDGLVETYEVDPTYWVFVPSRFITAPRLRTYIVPPYRRTVILRETRIVNRTVPVHGRLAVNPGISPAFVARMSGAPVATYRVRPRVFASTQGVAGAVQVRREDLRGARGGRPGGPGGPGERARLGAISVQRTTTVIQPNAAVTAPQPLGKNERGRLGNNPPRAAQGAPSIAPVQQPPPSTAPPSGLQRQVPAIQQQTPAVTPPSSPPPPPGVPPATTAPATTSPAQREERREEHPERGGPAGGPPPQQPNIVRPIPPQASPPPPPPAPQLRQVQPPPPPPPPPPPQQKQVQPPPPPPPPQQRQMQPQPPPAAGGPAPPPPRQGPPPKKPPPKPGEQKDEKK